MADGKPIIIFFICMNVLATILVFTCNMGEGFCNVENFDTSVLNQLFVKPSNNMVNIFASGGDGLQVTDNFSSSIRKSTEAQTGVSGGGVVSFFVDGLKMVIGIVLLFTPLPFLDFLNSLGMPIFITMIIGIPIFIAWIISMVEFIRGSPL